MSRPLEENIDYRAKNAMSCNALLSRLVRFHGVTFTKTEAVVIVEPPAEPPLLPPPVDPRWIKMIEEMPDPKGPSVKEIKLCVAQHFNLSPRDLESPRRFAKIVVPRQIAFYLARKLTTRSFPEIGRRFGNRDHSTILHSCKVIEQKMQADQQLAKTVRLLEARLQ